MKDNYNLSILRILHSTKRHIYKIKQYENVYISIVSCDSLFRLDSLQHDIKQKLPLV